MAEREPRESIALKYQEARDRGDAAAMRRHQNEEACLVLLTILERLAQDDGSFVHGVALKGGILMAGEFAPRGPPPISMRPPGAATVLSRIRSSTICVEPGGSLDSAWRVLRSGPWAATSSASGSIP